MTAGGPDRGPAADVRLVPAALAAWVAALTVTAGTGPRAATAAALVCAVGAGVAVLVHRLRVPAARPAPLVGLALLAAAGVLAAGAVQVGQRAAAMPSEGGVLTVEGRLLADPRPTGEGRHRVRLRTTRPAEVPAGRLLVLEGTGWADVPFGAVVRARGTVQPSPPGRPELAVLLADAPEVLEPPSLVARQVTVLRSGLAERAAASRVDGLGLVPGTALGDARAVPAPVRRAMRVTGLAHVTAVSGAHVAVVLGAVLGALSALPRLHPLLRSAAAALALIGFAVVVHAGPSVVRATLMGLVALLGPVLGRPGRALPALAAVVVGMLVLDPWAARDVGFRLSVAATVAIVLLASPLAGRLPLPGPLATAVAVPSVAQAAATPVLLLAGDDGVGPYAVVANALAVPALPVATLAGVAATVAGPVLPGVADALVVVAGVAARWIAGVGTSLAGLPGAWLVLPRGPVPVWLACGALALLAALATRRVPRS